MVSAGRREPRGTPRAKKRDAARAAAERALAVRAAALADGAARAADLRGVGVLRS